jgi:hypothetical protein
MNCKSFARVGQEIEGDLYMDVEAIGGVCQKGKKSELILS